MPPPVPITVKELDPVEAPPATETTIADVPVPGAPIEEGVKVTVTWSGSADVVKEMAESKPFSAVVVIVEVPELPGPTLSEMGDAVIVKFPLVVVVVVMVKLTEVVDVRAPLVPVTVIV